jgi:hypothetical protein
MIWKKLSFLNKRKAPHGKCIEIAPVYLPRLRRGGDKTSLLIKMIEKS